MATATNLGFPRMGANRESKKLVESYWSGKTSLQALNSGAKAIRAQHWLSQSGIAAGHIPSNDFSLYDHVLDHSFMFGVIPQQYQQISTLQDQYFAMGRGFQRDSIDVQAMEMKKYMDTNYHYITAPLSPETKFALKSVNEGPVKPVAEYLEAKVLGLKTRPVLLGPISYLLLQKSAKSAPSGFNVLSLLPALLPLYTDILGQLKNEGAEWIQFDEPCLVLDLPSNVAASLKSAYQVLHESAPHMKFLLTTYFESLPRAMLSVVTELPIAAFHLDLVRAPEQLDAALAVIPAGMTLSLGVVDGRNVWKTDFEVQLKVIAKVVERLGAHRVFIAPSCSLLHSPHSLRSERKMNSEIRNWMAFAVEKIDEIVTLTLATNYGIPSVQGVYDDNVKSHQSRRTSPLIHNHLVQEAMKNITPALMKRKADFDVRSKAQQAHLHLPLFPTTTIGSFPQTKSVRIERQKFKRGESSSEEYDKFLREEIGRTVKIQEDLGLDVLVHGESERNDMVEYFGELLDGFVFSEFGWVQSYGSRCVKPPIIYGDITRPNPMTVKWSSYAQSITKKPMKGMLTGPITIEKWSFVRNDQPLKLTTWQIALALRKEILDLEAAGISIIQVDEAAMREGLPLRKSLQGEYLQWAVDAFLISTTGVRNETQIHTHMCYSDFNDIFDAIKRMDADCITIENSKSDLKLLSAIESFGYSNGIGPGIYDIHSPRVPSVEEMKQRVQAISSLKKELLWINPDCGLKTRGWEETEQSLKNMVSVAHQLRMEAAGAPIASR